MLKQEAWANSIVFWFISKIRQIMKLCQNSAENVNLLSTKLNQLANAHLSLVSQLVQLLRPTLNIYNNKKFVLLNKISTVHTIVLCHFIDLFELSNNSISKWSSLILQRLGVSICPPVENRRSTGALEGIGVLYLRNISFSVGYFFTLSNCLASSLRYLVNQSFSLNIGNTNKQITQNL